MRQLTSPAPRRESTSGLLASSQSRQRRKNQTCGLRPRTDVRQPVLRLHTTKKESSLALHSSSTNKAILKYVVDTRDTLQPEIMAESCCHHQAKVIYLDTRGGRLRQLIQNVPTFSRQYLVRCTAQCHWASFSRSCTTLR